MIYTCWLLGLIFSEMKSRPIDNVENEEDDRERYEHCNVHGTGLVFLHGGRQLSKRFDLHLEQNDCILEESAEDEKDAANHPGLHCI